MSALELPPGNPSSLKAELNEFAATALTMERVVESLATVDVQGDSKSGSALFDAINGANTQLGKAKTRYDGTVAALNTYVVEFEKQFNAASTASADYDTESQAIAKFDGTIRSLENYLDDLYSQQASVSAIDNVTAAIATAKRNRGHAISRQEDAELRHRNAMAALHDAADIAAASIHDALDGSSDKWNEGWGSFWQWVGDHLDEFTQWVGDVLQGIVDFLIEVVKVIVIVIAVIVLVALIIAFLPEILAALGSILLVVIADIVLIALSLVAFTAFAEWVGMDDQWQAWITVGILSALNPLIGAFIYSRIAIDVLSPAPEPKPLDVSALDSGAADAFATLQGNAPCDSIDDFLREAADLDNVGGADQTVVQFTEITDPHGVRSWVVTLPSTKDWVMANWDALLTAGLVEKGAFNDLDADLTLILTPELAGKYERFLATAMTDAGIGPGEHVLMTGWSLGGIQAGSFAEKYPQYDVTGIVAAGSPMSTFDTGDAAVLIIDHHDDPVPHAATEFDSPSGENITFVAAPSPGAWYDVMANHNGVNYAASLEMAVTAFPDIEKPYQEFLITKEEMESGYVVTDYYLAAHE